LKFLIVDDNAAVRRLIRSIVLPFACEIRESTTGEAAIAAYTASRPDLVLMDVRLDEMDGIEATRRILALDSMARIVIVTAYDDDELRAAAAHAGASGYVLKDNLLDLVRVLEEL